MSELEERCDYCNEKNSFLISEVEYYNFGFKKRDISICKKCYEDKREGRRLFVDTAIVSENSTYQEIRDVIKEKDGVINYYDAVKEAYKKNGALAGDFSRRNLKANDIDKNLKYLWKFTFHIANKESKKKDFKL
jgi:hypothetical protein